MKFTAILCPDWGTCCQNPDTSYGCCPYKNGECCSDFIHCCPLGTHCNVTKGSCDSSKAPSLTFQWMVPQYHPKFFSVAFDTPEINSTIFETSEPIVSTDEGDLCPDGTPCREEGTCCSVGGGHFGCCPYRNAQCCTDFVHCCPDGYDCDVARGQCRKRSNVNSTINLNNLPIFNLERKDFELASKKELCGPSNSCSLKGKVCCSYGNSVTCCPKDSTCLPEAKADVSEVSGYIFFKSFTNLEDNADNKADKLGIVCPDKTEACPVDNTCCMMSSGRYGCCPMPDATCCPDHLTCCPSQYECVGNNGCERKPFSSSDALANFCGKEDY
ncbi:Granulin [Armadillidium nasatum]|uniref:Granulin n=1 Tax=Armadillidium nasatum TaxID=96803 RepID=A0A5N5TMD4_9CRUS|nr:Granulin [Armadillidium nasatum]